MGKELDEVTAKYYRSLHRYYKLLMESAFHLEEIWNKFDPSLAEKVISFIYKDEEIDKKKLKEAVSLFKNRASMPVEFVKEMDPVDAVELRFPGFVAKARAEFSAILDDLCKYSDYSLNEKYEGFALDRSAPLKCSASIVAIRMIEEKFLTGDTTFIARFINLAVEAIKSAKSMSQDSEYFVAGLAYRINHFVKTHSESNYSSFTIADWRAIVEYELEDAFPGVSPEGVEKRLQAAVDCFSGKYIFGGIGHGYGERAFYKKSQTIRDGALFYAYLVVIADGDHDFGLEHVYEKITDFSFDE